MLKRKGVGGMWHVVGGRWGMKNRGYGQGTGGEGLPAADACQHHSLNLSCGSRKPTDLEKEFLF